MNAADKTEKKLTPQETSRIKICGLRREEDIRCVNRLLPEYIGFVFAAKSRRYLSPEEAMRLREKLDPSITPVGVFVNEDPKTVAQLLERGVIEIAQLHGQEDENYIAFLRMLTDKPILKAFPIRTKEDTLRALRCSAWSVLADNGAGGTGEAFDWDLLSGLVRPYFLAGGLNCGNVESAVRLLHPFAVDVSSGVETDGFKDPEKIEQFIMKVRRCRDISHP